MPTNSPPQNRAPLLHAAALQIPVRDCESRSERYDETTNGREDCVARRFQQFARIYLSPDIEHHDEDPELGDELQPLVIGQPAQQRWTKNHASQQLPEHRRIANAIGR